MKLQRLQSEFDQVSGIVIRAALRVHSQLGPGLFEKVYKTCLKQELIQDGLQVESEVAVPINYGNISIAVGYRIDLLVENTLIVELKSVESLLPIHQTQLITYLKLMKKEVGLLLNFNTRELRRGIKRLVNSQHRLG